MVNTASCYNSRVFMSYNDGSGNYGNDNACPDVVSYVENFSIPDSFVLCRDVNGKPTAIYGEDVWCFKPYRLASHGNTVMSFCDYIKTSDVAKMRNLVNEAKKIMFSIIYYVHAGAVGALSVTTLLHYYHTVMHAVRFCISCENDKMLGVLSLEDLFSNKLYLSRYLVSIQSRKRRVQQLNALLNHLNNIGEQRLGFSVAKDLNIFKPIQHNQTPLIPTRIYLEYINVLTDRVAFLKENTNNIESFIKLFSDPFLGLHKKNQLGQGCPRNKLRLSMDEVIELYGLKELLLAHKPVTNRAQLNGLLSQIQYEMKMVIHLYTGMRNDEVNRLPYDCIIQHRQEKSISDRDGVELVPEQIIQLLSTTTKFEGYRKEVTWFAHSVVLDAVTILKRIVRGYAAMVSIEPEKCPLFVSTVGIFLKFNIPRDRLEVCIFKEKRKVFDKTPEFIIKQSDYDVLQASDPSRNFSDEQSFQVGNFWPLKTHQFRRSLAFYAINSGFVSLPTVRKQFKHLTQEMAKYYSRNNGNIKSIFGCFDAKMNMYVLPLNHIAYEVQVGMPIATAEALLLDILNSDASLHGKTGGYFERHRRQISDGDISIESLKEETVKKVANGEISYRKTLLGGCTNINECECAILGEFSNCLTSECAVIKSSNIESLIERMKRELSLYEQNSIEYSAAKNELDDLLRYKMYNIDDRV